MQFKCFFEVVRHIDTVDKKVIETTTTTATTATTTATTTLTVSIKKSFQRRKLSGTINLTG